MKISKSIYYLIIERIIDELEIADPLARELSYMFSSFSGPILTTAKIFRKKKGLSFVEFCGVN